MGRKPQAFLKMPETVSGSLTAMVASWRAYDQMGQSTKARAILEESVKLSPRNLRAHRTLIKIYQSQGLNDRHCNLVPLSSRQPT